MAFTGIPLINRGTPIAELDFINDLLFIFCFLIIDHN